MSGPASSRLAWAAFDLALRPWMASALRLHMAGLPRHLPERPVLLCANHESFWDGFILRALQRRIRPGGRFHAVMLQRELSRHPWLRLLGAIGLEPGSVSSARAMMRAMRDLAACPDAVVAYFPQGRIRPGDPRPPEFRRGVERVARALAPATVVPVGLRLLPGRSARTEVFLSVGSPIEVPEGGRLRPGVVEAAVMGELNALRVWSTAHGEDAAALWPGSEARLPRAPDPSWISRDVESWTSRN